MTVTADIIALSDRFLDQWGDLTPVSMEGLPALPDQDDAWVRFTIRPGKQRYFGGNGNHYEQLGRVYLQIFVPTGQGDGLAYELAERFIEIFRDYRVENLICETPDLDVVGEDGPWLQVNVSVFWRSIRQG